MILIQKVEHALAAAANDIVKSAKFVEHAVLPALQRAKADEGTIEAITALVSPQAVSIERIAFALVGAAIKAIQDGGAAADAGGVNIALDAAFVADIRAIAPTVQSAVKGAA